ncbi:MAG TPA: EAL domain-containing protein [Actinomycetota bacterium]|nr:EAL domain-containing protein [Actinomycetota bacterium]
MDDARPRVSDREALPRGNLLRRILGLAREQVGLEAAVLAEFTEGQEVVHSVDGDVDAFGLLQGSKLFFQEGFSIKAFESRPFGLIPDVRADPRLRDILANGFAELGSYIGAPVFLPDGRVWGSLFCLGREPATSLDERDVRMLETLGRLAGEELDRREREGEEIALKLRRVRRTIERGIVVHFQPICDLRSSAPIGVEALTRFDGTPHRSPDKWFAEAAEVGLGVDLEVIAARAALDSLPMLPKDAFVSVNASPQAIVSSRFLDMIRGYPGERVVVELTEHVEVENYVFLNAALATLRGRGVRIAVDDLGAGFASLRHVLRLRPDVIKLDITLTRDIDADPVRRALATSFISFADDIHAEIVAEGIETSGELEALRALGVPKGQGFFLARPAPLEVLRLPERPAC